jgi:diaminohydroxyphosphoribosylaminopyrimidine deaminase/5-amino-6-(5-phosphoribosylamino)uracil reductase
MATQQHNTDEQWMLRAVALARRGEGRTRPNPPVGAVVVRQGRLLGTGWHHQAGLPHAEVEAIRACHEAPQGATIYVTLEPCCTHGRTPPCTELLIRSGIARVVVGCVDPNPSHASRGLRILRKAGLTVSTGVCEDACRQLIEPFAMRWQSGRPFVTLKLAMTLDGRIADRSGRSQWITGPEARQAVQALRRRADAILVGAGTVRADDPSLRCRLPGAPDVWRVVVDGAGRTPATAQLLTDRWADTTVMITTKQATAATRQRWARQGAQVWVLPAGARGMIAPRRILQRLAQEGALHVVCEGGGQLAGALIKAGLVDEYQLFYAPAILGDLRGISGVCGADFRLATMPRLQILEVSRLGADLLVRARPAPAPVVTEETACLPG